VEIHLETREMYICVCMCLSEERERKGHSVSERRGERKYNIYTAGGRCRQRRWRSGVFLTAVIDINFLSLRESPPRGRRRPGRFPLPFNPRGWGIVYTAAAGAVLSLYEWYVRGGGGAVRAQQKPDRRPQPRARRNHGDGRAGVYI